MKNIADDWALIALLLFIFALGWAGVSFIKADIADAAERDRIKAESKETYYRGDIVMLTIGAKASISDKRIYMVSRSPYKFAWTYDVNTAGSDGAVHRTTVSEVEIESLIKPSPTRPVLERK